MPLFLDKCRCKLINKILVADSHEEVKVSCDVIMKKLEKHRINRPKAVLFADNMITELGSFNPMNKDSQQWSNIQMAKTYLNSIKQLLNPTVG